MPENQVLSLLSPGARPGQPTEGFRSLRGSGSGLSAVLEHRLPSYQGKTVIQAEIDAAAELIDFFRFNAKFAVELEGEQPISVPPSTNHVVYRGLEVLQGRRWVTGCREPQAVPHPHPLSSGLCGSYLTLQLHRNRRQPGGRTRLNGEEPRTRGVRVSHAPDLKPAQPPPLRLQAWEKHRW